MDMTIADWRDEKSLSNCLMHMLESENMCDVTFIVGEDKIRISAHKVILASRSAVFHAMFNGSLPEKGDVTVPDIDEKTFREILRFIYCDEFSVTEHNVKELVYASEKYMLTALKKSCEEALKKIATTEHATKALETAYQYNLNGLQRVSSEYIEKHAKECLSSKHALDLSSDCLKIILQNDFLDCSETDVCKFFIEWTRKQCAAKGLEQTTKNMKEVVGDLLYLVRFPAVDMKYFSADIASSGLLSDKEVISVYQSYHEKYIKTSIFYGYPRGPISKRKVYSIERGTEYEDFHPYIYYGVHALTFQCNTNIWLKSLIVLTPTANPVTTAYTYHAQNYSHTPSEYTTYDIEFKINDSEKEETCMSVTMDTSTNLSHVHFDMFEEPLLVTAGKDYTVALSIPMIDFPNGSQMRIIKCPSSTQEPATGVKFTFKSSPKSTTGTNEKLSVFKSFSFSV